MRLIVLLLLVTLTGCTGLPENVEPVSDFELDRYLGKWYEIARLPHSFEEGLSNVTAQYRLRNDGGVAVLNRGYSDEEQAWEEAQGKAYFVEDENIGHLKVSFFGPFYASYVIVELDEAYNYAMVTGPDRDYLWLLSRTPELDDEIVSRLVNKAKSLGYAVDKLIYVKQQIDT